jgi:hypothetical protein
VLSEDEAWARRSRSSWIYGGGVELHSQTPPAMSHYPEVESFAEKVHIDQDTSPDIWFLTNRNRFKGLVYPSTDNSHHMVRLTEPSTRCCHLSDIIMSHLWLTWNGDSKETKNQCMLTSRAVTAVRRVLQWLLCCFDHHLSPLLTYCPEVCRLAKTSNAPWVEVQASPHTNAGHCPLVHSVRPSLTTAGASDCPG